VGNDRRGSSYAQTQNLSKFKPTGKRGKDIAPGTIDQWISRDNQVDMTIVIVSGLPAAPHTD